MGSNPVELMTAYWNPSGPVRELRATITGRVADEADLSTMIVAR